MCVSTCMHISVYIHVHMYAYMCMYIHVHCVHICMCNRCACVEATGMPCTFFFFKTGSLTVLEIIEWVKLAGQKAPGTMCLYLFGVEIMSLDCQAWLFFFFKELGF